MLRRAPVDGRLGWIVSARAGDRAGFTYRTRPDGSGFEDLSPEALRSPDSG